MEGIATITSEVLGRTIRRIVVSDKEFRDRMMAQGVPDASINMRMGMCFWRVVRETSHKSILL
jgi:hypothetical protein